MNTYYQPTNSLLHRLNPLSKLTAFVPPLIFVALTNDAWVPLAFILLTLCVTFMLGRVSLKRFMSVNGPILLMLIGFLIFYPIAIRPELVVGTPVLFHLGPLTVYRNAVFYGFSVVLRAYALCLISLCFSFTTDASDFIRALVQQWRFPYKLGYGALAAFRFVPLLQSELRLIQAAHKVRGISDQGGVRTFYQRLRRYAVPLLATAIRRAERTALAMDGRAFGAFARRTYFKRFRFQTRDYLFVLGFWLLCTLLIVLCWRAGLLGTLSWDKTV
ncbi:energy-coupling factor transporter transmembrane component T family protein [Ktedonospora formicarum]|uniref:Putative HMP/thiamine permease protein YkoC n=1 Tax=Ktedonospora formicarum TaxID=2778364 RepID=A0A8J3I9J4_9CHLR|nr:energy-coupling factor transporter transmembrane component T [Ktedonospora formicarum]GHO48258.1 putative HMP/thiamine permease protein YkoC [Ktedonospora formicarum]